ncbi:MAG: alpha/beta hydrolase [Saprospiraceae bacterium]|nr:MAG: alpha/beta hydrolase [Saprospiraceae bacterium]
MDLNFKEFGQGDPIIILHGMFGTLDNWQTIGKQLAEHYTVFLIDQRNHGRSPHTDSINYPALAEDLGAFMEAHWIYKTHLIGHSMGGKTAMQFATSYPDLVDKLVVVDIAPKQYEGGHREIIDALLALNPDNIQSRQEADTFMESRIEDFGVRQFLLKNLTRTKAGNYRWKMNLDVINQHYADILAPGIGPDVFEGQALFLRGEKSNYILDEDWPDILSHFPNAQLQTVPKAGHWVHAEAPEVLLAAVTDFLQK